PLDQPSTADAPVSGEHSHLHELEDLFERAPVPIQWVALDGTILQANQAALDLLGYARDQYIGHHLSEFAVDASVPGDLLDRLAAGEALRDVPIRLRGKDGTLTDLRLDASPYPADGVRYTRWFTHDVTTQRLAQEAARWTQER